MRLHYEDELVTLWHGDCREFLADAVQGGGRVYVVTDPPYGDTSLKWDVPVDGWLDPLGLVSNSLWCFGSLRMFMAQAGDFRRYGWKLAQDVVWEKHNGSNFHADRFRRVHEHAVHFYQGEWRNVWKDVQTTPDATARTVRRKERPPHTGEIENSTYVSEDGGPRMMRSVIRVRSMHGRAEHPTQKPVGIVRPLIDYSCPPDGTVVDPFAGSGSILVAAKEAGRRAIGIEINRQDCDTVARRLETMLGGIAA